MSLSRYLSKLAALVGSDGKVPAAGIAASEDFTFNGVKVGKGAGSVATNTAVGVSALAGSNSGSGQNTAVGYETLKVNTSGAYNCAYGLQSLALNTTGSNNSAIGYNALAQNTTASNNTAVGYQAAYANTTGTGLVAVGLSALAANTTGNGNVAFGQAALSSNTTGSENTAIGSAYSTYASLRFNTTGEKNVAVGSGALSFNTTSSNNTAIGYKAGYTQTTALGNTFVGYQAGLTHNAVGDGYNTAIGNTALASMTTGVRNTALGTDAGSQITTGSKNTILGRYNGNQGGLDIRTANNYIVLSDGDGNPRGVFDSSGNLLVGTTSNGSNQKINVVTTGNGQAINTSSTTATVLELDVNSNNTSQYALLVYSQSLGGINAIVYSNGNIQNRNNSYGAFSDVKLKENIVDATPKLDKLNQVRVVNYNLIGDEKKQLGVIAQELEAVFPSMVEESPDKDREGNELGTTTKSVKYSVFVPMLIKAIQELKAEFDAYKEAHP